MPKRRKRSQLGKLPKPLHEVDFYLLISVLAILAYGLVMVLTAGSVRGYNETDNTFFYVLKQGKWAVLGSFLALTITRIPFPVFRRFAGLGIAVTLLLLVLVLNSDSAIEANGASRWLKIGPVNVQPSEIAKIALILFLANYLDRYPVKKLKDLAWPALVLIPLLALVYKQPDLGTTLVLVVTAAALLWQTELRTGWFLLAVPMLGGPLLYLIYNTPYQWNRILVWLDPWQYASGMGYQITNAEIAFGSGGIFGVGLGRSLQKFGYLPETYTDMIFALIGEELGLMGTLFLIGLFIFCFGRAFYISRKCPDRFGRLLSFGITFSLAIQSGINLSVVTGVLPVTGITLPLVSYGGSSLVITLVEIGILLNISRYSHINSPHPSSFSMLPIEGQTLRE
ncbi:MAG: putative lipid II flippase FtsW [Desulfitobacterium sp.]